MAYFPWIKSVFLTYWFPSYRSVWKRGFVYPIFFLLNKNKKTLQGSKMFIFCLIELIKNSLNKWKPGKGSWATVTVEYKSFLTYAAEMCSSFKRSCEFCSFTPHLCFWGITLKNVVLVLRFIPKFLEMAVLHKLCLVVLLVHT